MNVLLSTAYWPNLHYMFYVLQAENISIEQQENYRKQSFRNRCIILSANGPLHLSIPVKHNKSKELISEVEIEYKENWRAKHWRAIQSAYNNSPYFEYFEKEIKNVYEKDFQHLLSFNIEQLQLILKIFRLNKKFELSQQFEKSPLNKRDLRNGIDPKTHFSFDALVTNTLNQEYYQTFNSKFKFVPNLSVLDLLFNKGLGGIDYLRPAQSDHN